MLVVNLNKKAAEIVEALNNESRKLKVRINLGGFAWVEDESGFCVENGFCLIGNSDDIQRGQIKRLAIAMGITVIVI